MEFLRPKFLCCVVEHLGTGYRRTAMGTTVHRRKEKEVMMWDNSEAMLYNQNTIEDLPQEVHR